MAFFTKRKRIDRVARARRWLTQDTTGRVVGLVILSVVLSIAVSLLVAAIAGAISRCRVDRAAPDGDAEAVAEPEAGAEGDAPDLGAEPISAGVPVMEDASPGAEEHATT